MIELRWARSDERVPECRRDVLVEPADPALAPVEPLRPLRERHREAVAPRAHEPPLLERVLITRAHHTGPRAAGALEHELSKREPGGVVYRHLGPFSQRVMVSGRTPRRV
jgi:hypothetical protein